VKKKLIEVALPLEAINKESAREKSIRHGHPSTLHLWWARRPLAACRAVLFASLVDDPSSLPDQFPTEADQDKERQRLFRLIEELVKWENTNNHMLLKAAHEEILKSTDGNPPPIYDPFCGGGSIPLEAQRLGLESYGSDLNPVAVLMTKALIEVPPHAAGQPPVNPGAKQKMCGLGMWSGARGLADDVRYYGGWMRDRAFERVGHLYSKSKLPKELGGGEATVIARIWARTVLCPNPACGARMPLVRSFALSTKVGKQSRVEPVIEHASKMCRFEVRTGEGTPVEGTKLRGRSRCLFCGTQSTTPNSGSRLRFMALSTYLWPPLLKAQLGAYTSRPKSPSIKRLRRRLRRGWISLYPIMHVGFRPPATD
jgi:putative DNA methylase